MQTLTRTHQFSIPSVNLGIFVFLRLVISIRVLGLGGILGGLLGIIGIIL